MSAERYDDDGFLLPSAEALRAAAELVVDATGQRVLGDDEGAVVLSGGDAYFQPPFGEPATRLELAPPEVQRQIVDLAGQVRREHEEQEAEKYVSPEFNPMLRGGDE